MDGSGLPPRPPLSKLRPCASEFSTDASHTRRVRATSHGGASCAVSMTSRGGASGAVSVIRPDSCAYLHEHWWRLTAPCWVPGTMGVAASPRETRDNLHCDFLLVGYRG